MYYCILEYDSSVWNSHSMTYYRQLERVLRRFFSYVVYKLNIFHPPPHNYDFVFQNLCLLSLADYRLSRELIILRNLVNDKTGSLSSP